SYPTLPSPGSIPFDLLLWAFVLHVVKLHLPTPPSPLFLFSQNRTLPLAIFVSRGISRVILPSVLFFLPALLFAMFVLSFSLMDILPNIVAVHLPPVHLSSSNPAPMETRITILYLLGTIIVVLVSSVFIHATALLPFREELNPWDRYSR